MDICHFPHLNKLINRDLISLIGIISYVLTSDLFSDKVTVEIFYKATTYLLHYLRKY